MEGSWGRDGESMQEANLYFPNITPAIHGQHFGENQSSTSKNE